MFSNTSRWIALSFFQPVIWGTTPEIAVKTAMPTPRPMANWCGLMRSTGDFWVDSASELMAALNLLAGHAAAHNSASGVGRPLPGAGRQP